MKIRLPFIAVITVLLSAISCNVERSEKYQTLLAERDSLYTEAVASKGGFDQALNTINEIEAALESVRAAEGIIMMESEEGNTNKAVSEINAIQQTLRENRNKIANLEKELASQGAQSKALNQTVSRLKKQLEEKDTYINNLRSELEASKVQVATLTEQVNDLNQNVDSLNANIENLSAHNAEQHATIIQQDAEINTVYYMVVPMETLQEYGLVTNDGIFSKKASNEIDKKLMIAADKRELNHLSLNTRKETILTNHPESSYTLTKGDDKMYSLDIVDPEAFWNISNYLIISIK